MLELSVGATCTGDKLKTTLGPHGRDKMLISAAQGRDTMVNVTNDGATILKLMDINNPAAKLLVDVSKTQDDEVGDGTTTVVVLASEIMRQCEPLLQKLHPQIVAKGVWEASVVAKEALLASAVTPDDMDAALLRIARTTLSSKVLALHGDHFAQLAVEAVKRLGADCNLEAIHVIKKLGGTVRDSFLAEGFVLDKKIGVGQPKRIEKAKILVANTSMDTDKIKIYGARVKVDSIAKLAEMEKAEKEKMRAKCQKIMAHGINVFINRQLIYNLPEEIFAQNKIMAIEHADFEGVERLASVLGAELVSTFDMPERVVLGECELLDEIVVGDDTMIRFGGCKKTEACTIILRASSQNFLDEAERALHDVLCVLAKAVKDHRTVLGAGCTELLMAKAVEDAAQKIPEKHALAMRAFAKALRQLPGYIAENAGLDALGLIQALEAEHNQGNSFMGLDLPNSGVADIRTLGVTEPLSVKQSAVAYATDAAVQLLRADRVLTCTPRPRQDPHARRRAGM